MVSSPAREASEGCSLADAPLPWLSSLARSTSSLDRVSLLKTCKVLRDVVLDVSVAQLALDLPDDLPTRRALPLKRAQAVLKRAREVTCHITFLPRLPPGGDLTVQDMQAGVPHAGYMASLLHQHVALLTRPLTNLTRLTILGMHMTEIVPSSLIICCPNLTHLVVQECVTTGLPVAESLLPCTSLRHLTVSKTNFQFIGGARPAINLSNLQGLSELHIKAWPLETPDLQNLAQLGEQLTYLHLDQQDSLAPLCVPMFTTLTRLALPDTFVSEESFKLLLGMGELRRVQLGNITNLETDFSEEPCAWELLGVGTVSLAAVARLPCRNIGQIVHSEDRFDIILADAIGEGVDTANRALANLARCPQVKIGSPFLVIDCYDQADQAAALVAALPILRYATQGNTSRGGHVELDIMNCDVVTVEVLQAMSTHVPARFSILSFISCHWDNPAVDQMFLASLPPSVQRCGLLVQNVDQDFETAVDLIRRVAPHATRPITVLMAWNTEQFQLDSLLVHLHGLGPAAQLVSLDKDILDEPNCFVVV